MSAKSGALADTSMLPRCKNSGAEKKEKNGVQSSSTEKRNSFLLPPPTNILPLENSCRPDFCPNETSRVIDRVVDSVTLLEGNLALLDAFPGPKEFFYD